MISSVWGTRNTFHFLYVCVPTLLLVTLSGCANENVRFGLLPMTIEEMLTPANGEAQTDPQYEKEPPCKHPGDEKQGQAHKDRCTRKNPAHVAYWTSRPDRWRIACKGQPASYCDEGNAATAISTGGPGAAVSVGTASMVPHCHGFGKARFCHSHPGGSSPHDHLVDVELASVVPSN